MTTGNVPTPAVKRGSGPDALDYGEAAAVNELVGLVPAEPDQPFTPSGDAESFLFSPTDRPNEPFSHGAPFGAGPNVTAPATEADFVMKTTRALQSQPVQSPEVKAFLAKLNEGL